EPPPRRCSPSWAHPARPSWSPGRRWKSTRACPGPGRIRSGSPPTWRTRSPASGPPCASAHWTARGALTPRPPPAPPRSPARRFRTAAGVPASTLSVSTAAGQLLLATDMTRAGLADQRAFIFDAPLPVPAIRAGEPPGWAYGDRTLAPFGGDQAPVRVVGTAP